MPSLLPLASAIQEKLHQKSEEEERVQRPNDQISVGIGECSLRNTSSIRREEKEKEVEAQVPSTRGGSRKERLKDSRAGGAWGRVTLREAPAGGRVPEAWS